MKKYILMATLFAVACSAPAADWKLALTGADVKIYVDVAGDCQIDHRPQSLDLVFL